MVSDANEWGVQSNEWEVTLHGTCPFSSEPPDTGQNWRTLPVDLPRYLISVGLTRYLISVGLS